MKHQEQLSVFRDAVINDIKSIVEEHGNVNLKKAQEEIEFYVDTFPPDEEDDSAIVFRIEKITDKGIKGLAGEAHRRMDDSKLPFNEISTDVLVFLHGAIERITRR